MCDRKQLSQVPVFSRHNEQNPYLYLYLNNNQLTSIQAYAFQNLSTVNASNVYVYLSNNHIANIESHAFSGIESSVTSLNLENNNLTHLPSALGQLSALTQILLLGNPLSHLDATILANIGIKLTSLTISMGHLSRFPTELNALTKLTSLIIDDIPFQFVHSTVFHGFENSLISLEMSHTDFERIPAAVCRLKVLKTFKFNYSPDISKYNSSIFDECTHSMTTVTSLTLRDDKLTIFPKLTTILPNLQFLDLSYNLLHFIESTSLAGLHSLATLSIYYNQFLSVPSAINSATNLKTLHVAYNNIQTVEDFDFLRLHNLTQVILTGNPLVYVSPYAFTHSPLLNYVYLDNTMLDHVPRALLGLKHLRYLFLSGKPIACSCQAMSYLKAWNVSSINIYRATCSSGQTVNTYLTTDLPQCT